MTRIALSPSCSNLGFPHTTRTANAVSMRRSTRARAFSISAHMRVGLIIADQHLPSWLIAEERASQISGGSQYATKVGAALLAAFPKATIFTLVLHSVVNLWGFAWYENGRKIRATWGAADDGLMLDFGAPLPEEAVYRQSDDTPDVVGEDTCFAVSSRILGKRIDQFPLENIQLTRFKPARRPPWPLSLFKRS